MNEIDYIVEQLETLVNIPSPSGYTKQAMAYVEKTAKELGFTCTSLRKGGVVIHVPGKNPTEERVIGLSAHVDTLVLDDADQALVRSWYYNVPAPEGKEQQPILLEVTDLSCGYAGCHGAFH